MWIVKFDEEDPYIDIEEPVTSIISLGWIAGLGWVGRYEGGEGVPVKFRLAIAPITLV
jgi:hypothetical protein